MKLEQEVEKLRTMFQEQEEEMNRKLIEASARNVSRKKYLQEVEVIHYICCTFDNQFINLLMT